MRKKQITDTQRAKQKLYYGRHVKDLKPLQPGDVVRMQPMNNQTEWEKATVKQKTGIRSYEVHTENDILYRRNRKHLRKSNESPLFSSASEDFPSQLMNKPLIIPRDQIQNRIPRKENTDKNNTPGKC